MKNSEQSPSITLILVAITASLGGLLSGFDMGVISGALLYINQTWTLSPLEQGWLVSSAIVGSVIGAAANGVLADIYGRKKIIIATALIFIAGSLMCGYAATAGWLIFSRIIIGIAVGMISFVAPIYLSEIAPEKIRGSLVSLYQLALTAGILLSYLINRIFANTELNWRWMLGSGTVPAVILLTGILFLHDTPRWLISKNRIDEARQVFRRILKKEEVEAHISEIQETLSTSSEKQKVKIKKWMLMPVFVGVGLMFVQICTGINTIIYYTPTIFNLAGFSDNISAIYATIGIGLVNFLMTFIAIAYIDKFGRKPLLYIGLSGMLISLFILSGAFAMGESGKWLAVASVVIYIASFAMSLGPICWIMVSEIMPLKIRGFAMSAATVANFAFNFIVVLSFLPMLEIFGKAPTFFVFGLITILSLFFVYFFVPETKGISLEKIEKNWHNHIKPRNF
ncbi:MAG: sugar porter family MFS transporter [bacterium]|mgnify:CR=1 FL=1|nr:sugar porter family MFS transporter [bacterium]MDY2830601.1 sugar porter family MFS transporter [Alphaproteobacteria bacterium]